MMLKRALVLVVLCVLLSAASVWGQEVVYPSPPLAAVPNVMVFIQPLTNPGVATQNMRVANCTRQSITFQPWTMKGWVSTNERWATPCASWSWTRGGRRATSR